MKKKNKMRIYLLIINTILIILSCSCKKDDNNPTNGKTTAIFNPDLTYGTMADQDGNIYKTIKIGDLTWMAENLRVTTYNDGSPISEIIENDKWNSLTTGAYCNYNNTNNIVTIATYGRLYNWYAVITGKLAPKGWHIPTKNDWTYLKNYLAGLDSKLRETGTTHWEFSSNEVLNQTGFTALPGSCRELDGSFGTIGRIGFWWSCTEYDNSSAWFRGMPLNLAVLNEGIGPKGAGFSVRCIKD